MREKKLPSCVQKEKEKQKNGWENITLPRLNMEEGWPLKAGKGKDTESSPEHPKRNGAWLILWFQPFESPVRFPTKDNIFV